ncbi:unnamed protein product [Oppiella nova]|uniref:Phospholipid/glycerol acyltransferase domain-containing protein n=1 Tax=Oppiella nova TaxID=334625 RepID=A0A7R9LPI5_9ACAR|nr:unnamed protein product [Oppiella nova]CAG2165628.1 unnamed protein product [Oppiella nova]
MPATAATHSSADDKRLRHLLNSKSIVKSDHQFVATNGRPFRKQINDINGTQFAPFKTNANYFDPNLPRERPLIGPSCFKCTTNRSFHYASFVMTRKVDANFPDVCSKVIRSERVRTAITEAAEDDFHELQDDAAGLVDERELKTLERKHRSRAIDILQRMKSCISSSLLRIAGWVLYKLLSKILTTIQFHKGQIDTLRRSFHYASFVMTRKVDANFPDVCSKVIRSERVRTAITEAAEDDFHELQDDAAGLVDERELKTLERKHRSRAIDILQRMKSCISSSLLRIAGWVLYKLLSKILTTIQFHKGQIDTLRRCRTAANVPIIYLPLHRSHLDYILVSFILYMNNIKPPLVAAGDNLLIPFFGNLMRGLGAFFIKRRLDDSSGKRDHIYRAVLQSYMTENLKQGNSLEFFIEGGRSRSGKALSPKLGLLSVVVDSILEGEVEDAFIVPVAISYEKLMDGSFVGEQLGKPKVAESFSLAARSIWSTLHSNFGSVRVDFCQPFSLKDYLHNAAYNIHNSHLIIENRIHDKSCDKSKCVACSGHPNGLPSASSFQSLYGLDIVVSEDKRQTIEKLAEHVVYDAFNATPLMSTQLPQLDEHVVYDAFNATPLMSTQLVSFLLLTKHRKGTTLHQLAQSLNWLREECSRRNRELSISGDSLDVIRTACGFLGKDLVAIEKISMAWSSSDGLGAITENNNVKIVFLKPAVKLPLVLELQYYSNSCISIFLLDSVVVNALFALIDTQLESLTASGDNLESNITIDYNELIDKSVELCEILHNDFIFAPSNITIDYNELIDKSVELCEILHNDFIFAPPCADIRDLIIDKIENYIMYGLFCEAYRSTGTDHLRRRYRQYDFDDEDDGYVGQRDGFNGKRELRLVLSDENKQSISFYRSVLAAYVESYWVAASALTKLIDVQSSDEKTFFNGMIDIAKDKQQKGLLFHEECIAAEPFKNAVKLFESWNVLSVETNGSGVRHIRLTPEFSTIGALNEVIARIEEFKN